eukprot:m.49900 g.49900  ORF g.49900 m.49900 type:complete len:336 (+) comp13375_c0_seq2:1308-2315(+)
MRPRHGLQWLQATKSAFSARLNCFHRPVAAFRHSIQVVVTKTASQPSSQWLSPLLGVSIATGLYGGLYSYTGFNSTYRQDRLMELRAAAITAIRGNRLRELKDLLLEAQQLGDVELRDNMGRSLLSVAGAQGKLQPFKAILEAGADPTSRDKHGLSVLKHSAWKNQEFVVAHLLTVCRVDPNEDPDVFGLYSLHKASGYGNCQVLQLLLKHGANVNQRTGDITAPPSYEAKTKNETALAIASRLGFHSAMRVLLNHPGCDINVQDNLGDTCLHHACRKGDWRAVEILLNHGARLDLQNHKGETPDQAASNRKLRLAVQTQAARLYPTRLLAWLDV